MFLVPTCESDASVQYCLGIKRSCVLLHSELFNSIPASLIKSPKNITIRPNQIKMVSPRKRVEQNLKSPQAEESIQNNGETVNLCRYPLKGSEVHFLVKGSRANT